MATPVGTIPVIFVRKPATFGNNGARIAFTVPADIHPLIDTDQLYEITVRPIGTIHNFVVHRDSAG